MVHYMTCPEIIDVVTHPVEPIVRKIIGKEQQDPVPPFGEIEIKYPVSIKEAEQSKNQYLSYKAGHHIPNTETKTAKGVPGFIQMPVLAVREPGFNT